LSIAFVILSIPSSIKSTEQAKFSTQFGGSSHPKLFIPFFFFLPFFWVFSSETKSPSIFFFFLDFLGSSTGVY